MMLSNEIIKKAFNDLDEKLQERLLIDYNDSLEYEKRNEIQYMKEDPKRELRVLFNVVFRNIINPSQNALTIFKFLGEKNSLTEIKFEGQDGISINLLEDIRILVEDFWKLNEKYKFISSEILETEFFKKFGEF